MSLEFFDQHLYDDINEKVAKNTVTEDEIRMYSQYIRPSNFYENYHPSKNFLREFKDGLDWQQYCLWHCPSEEFVWEMKDYVWFNELLCNHPNDYSEDFYRRYFHFYFDKEKYLFYSEHPYQSVPKEEYKKQIGSVGLALEHGLGLRSITKLELLLKYELKQNVSNWTSRLNYTNPKYCKKGKTWK